MRHTSGRDGERAARRRAGRLGSAAAGIGVVRGISLARGISVALGLAAVSCGGAGEHVEITKERTASRPSIRVIEGVTSAQRFGNAMGMGGVAGGPSASTTSGVDASGAGVAFRYETPEGWLEAPTSAMRPVNLRPAGDPDAECYVTALAGDGGGLIANVDRWRKQLGLAPMSPSEADALPRIDLLGASGRLVELEGAYTGMGDDARPGWKLIGAVLLRPGSSVFVKLTGPAGLVDSERERFLGFCASLRQEGAPPTASSQDAAVRAQGAGDGGAGAGLAWSAPEGWVEGSARPMRLVSFAVGAASECYVTQLAGEGGGLVPNLDRWRRELGLDPTTPDEVAGLERVDVLGREAVLFEGVGSFSSMGGAPREDFALLGAICMRGDDSIFVKMVGPRAEVLPRRDEFLQFVGSLREAAR